MSLPEYYWAQGMVVALHPMRLAFDSNAEREAMPLNEVAEQLDSFRRTHKPTMIPPSSYYLVHCRTLHDVEASGPTAVSGWKRFCKL